MHPLSPHDLENLLIDDGSILVQSCMNFSRPIGIFLGSIRTQRDANAGFIADGQEPFAVMTGRTYEKAVGVRAFVGYIPRVVRKFLQDKIRRRRSDLQARSR